MSSRKSDLQALTGLRFFAAMAVLLFHSGGPALTATGRLPAFVANLFANGYLGVTFFFVLSGFILTLVYRGKLATSASVRDYGQARVARVYPVYLLALLLMIPFVPSADWRLAWQQFVLLQCWTTLQSSDVPAVWNMQSWTLSVELLFYLVFPLLVNGLDRLPTDRLVGLLVAVCGGIVVFRLSGIISAEQLPYAWMSVIPLPLLRFPEFVFGVLLGLLHARGIVPAAPRLLRATFVLALVVLAASASRWVAPVATLLFGAIIVLVPTSLGAGILGRVLLHPAMVLLGAASYSLYLLASPISAIEQALWGGAWLSLGRFLYVPSLILVSLAVFRWFEEPARTLLKRGFASRAQPAIAR